MACILQPRCNFLCQFFKCHLPVETVDVKVKITLMQDIRIFRRDRTCQIIKCNPWSTRFHLSPKSQQNQNQTRPLQPSTNPLVRRGTKQITKEGS